MGRITTFVALLVAVIVFGSPLLGFVQPSSNFAVIGVMLVSILVATLVIERHRGQRDTDGSTWDFIPRRQYNGRFAEAGGLTRAEQEKDLEKIQEQAAKRQQ